jgi:hypothetical protein
MMDIRPIFSLNIRGLDTVVFHFMNIVKWINKKGDQMVKFDRSLKGFKIPFVKRNKRKIENITTSINQLHKKSSRVKKEFTLSTPKSEIKTYRQ